MIVRIINENNKIISEDLYDEQSKLILCSLYCIRRPLTKLHLFFNKERILILAALTRENRLKEVHFSDKIKESIYNDLLTKKDTNAGCNYMLKWEFLETNNLGFGITPVEEAELTKLLVNKQII
ncbi:hypothetical protein AB9N12_18080 [Bacteroides sp. AN502(2024)]|uniref:hypothetical protein n=1 Tax=Bacteroides sp. AN502(2024) TaxID=3160599 RepID=UPI003511FEF5